MRSLGSPSVTQGAQGQIGLLKTLSLKRKKQRIDEPVLVDWFIALARVHSYCYMLYGFWRHALLLCIHHLNIMQNGLLILPSALCLICSCFPGVCAHTSLQSLGPPLMFVLCDSPFWECLVVGTIMHYALCSPFRLVSVYWMSINIFSWLGNSFVFNTK